MALDEFVGHSAPIKVSKEYTDALIKKLHELAPSFAYSWIFKDGLVHISIHQEGNQIWQGSFPDYWCNRWVLTLEEFLRMEIVRLYGTVDDNEEGY